MILSTLRCWINTTIFIIYHYIAWYVPTLRDLVEIIDDIRFSFELATLEVLYKIMPKISRLTL